MLRLLRSFPNDSRGLVAVTFAMCAMVLTAAVGCALDYSAASLLRTKLQSATDMTVLVAAKSATKLNDTELRTFATGILQTRMDDPTVTIETLNVTDGRNRVEITTAATYKTAILSVIGFETVPVRAFSVSFTLNISHEIALVIDNSGSMNASAGGASKMASAKEAANSLIDAMISTEAAANNTTFSLVPFTLAVKVGSQHANASWMDTGGASSIHWNNRNLDKTTALSSAPVASRFDLFTQLGIGWAGCVETRPGTYGTTDAAPSSATPDSLFVPMFAPDEPGAAAATLYYPNSPGSYTPEWTYNNSYVSEDQGALGNSLCTAGQPVLAQSQYVARHRMLCKYKSPPSIVTTYGRGPNRGCNAQPLLRLTGNSSTLKTAINGMVADGSTNLLEGFMWGWRTLSPNAPFAEGRAYATPNNRKVIILLTDGMNSWGSLSNGSGSEYSSFGYYNDNRIGTGIATMADARKLMDAKTLEACTNAKAQGIRVYTVGFSVSTDPIDADGLALLQNCATSTSMAYVANNSAEIVAVFEDIARNVTSVRIAM
jgi:Flp pilus assembly protein TadG